MSEKQECIRMKTLHPIYLVLLDQMIKGIRKEVWLEKSLDKYLHSTNGNIEYVGTRRGIPLTNDIGKVEPAKMGITYI